MQGFTLLFFEGGLGWPGLPVDLGVSRDDDHREGRRADELLRYTAEHETGQAASSEGAGDEDIRFHGLGAGDDRIDNVTLDAVNFKGTPAAWAIVVADARASAISSPRRSGAATGCLAKMLGTSA